MIIDARYLLTTVDQDIDNREFGNEKSILYSSGIDNELMTLTKANFIDNNYLPKCKMNDLNDSDIKFDIDEASDSRIYSTFNPDRGTESVESYSNIGRSRVSSFLLDCDVSAVKFLDKDKSNELIIDIDKKYIPFSKLMTVINTGLSDLNLIKTIHENSSHPHESLDKDIVTKFDTDPIFTNNNGNVTDLRTNTTLGFESESIQFK